MTRCVGCDGRAFGELELLIRLDDDSPFDVTIGVCQLCADRLKNGDTLHAVVDDPEAIA